MKYQLVNKTSKKTPIIITFYDDKAINEQAHIKQFNLATYLETDLKPSQKNVGLWVGHKDNPCFLYNLGKQEKFSHKQLKTALEDIFKQVKALKLSDVTLALPAITEEQLAKPTFAIIQTIENFFYQFKIAKKSITPPSIETIELMLIDGSQEEIDDSKSITEGMNLTQDLGNMPPNICTPTEFADIATKLAESDPNFNIKVLDEEQMADLGMNTILAVSKGSEEPARFIELNYQNGGDMAPIVLVGKGITFDSGGLSLKPPQAMYEMKYDMCGAATVLGTLKTVSLLNLPINVIGLIAASENLPGPSAIKPGSVVLSYSKKTIEILNTDAEGRLVLCDALTYAEQFNPSKVIDIATLTGAMIIALGHHTSGIMGNDQALCDELIEAGNTVNDRAWQLPLWEEYQSAMDSNIADVSNTAPDRSAGSISAGCFLARFAENYRWAHIDCAGTAWKSGKQKSATGRPVPLLVEFLQNEVERNAC